MKYLSQLISVKTVCVLFFLFFLHNSFGLAAEDPIDVDTLKRKLAEQEEKLRDYNEKQLKAYMAGGRCTVHKDLFYAYAGGRFRSLFSLNCSDCARDRYFRYSYYKKPPSPDSPLEDKP